MDTQGPQNHQPAPCLHASDRRILAWENPDGPIQVVCAQCHSVLGVGSDADQATREAVFKRIGVRVNATEARVLDLATSTRPTRELPPESEEDTPLVRAARAVGSAERQYKQAGHALETARTALTASHAALDHAQKALSALVASTAELPPAPARPVKRRMRRPKGKGLVLLVYDALTDAPQTSQEIADKSGVKRGSVTHFLSDLQRQRLAWDTPRPEPLAA